MYTAEASGRSYFMTSFSFLNLTNISKSQRIPFPLGIKLSSILYVLNFHSFKSCSFLTLIGSLKCCFMFINFLNILTQRDIALSIISIFSILLFGKFSF